MTGSPNLSKNRISGYLAPNALFTENRCPVARFDIAVVFDGKILSAHRLFFKLFGVIAQILFILVKDPWR